MTTPFKTKLSRSGNQQIDELTRIMIYQGITLSQATTIFRMDLRDIKSRVEGRVRPCGKRSGNPIYHIRDLAPFLCRPAYDIDEFIQKMNVADLPTMLRKEYWASRKAQQSFELEAGNLWKTEDVQSLISELFSTIRMAMLLSREKVERETELTPRQRKIIIENIDSTLEDANDKTFSILTARKSASSADISTAETDGAEEI